MHIYTHIKKKYNGYCFLSRLEFVSTSNFHYTCDSQVSFSKCLCVHKHFIEQALTVIPFFFVWHILAYFLAFINFISERTLIQKFSRNIYGACFQF